MRSQSAQTSTQLWSEYITTRPTRNTITNALILAMIVWTSGLTAFAWHGIDIAISYLNSVVLYGYLAYIPLMVLGLQYFHRNYMREVEEFRPHLRISSDESNALGRRLDFLLCNRWVVFISAALITGYVELTSVIVVQTPTGDVSVFTPLQTVLYQLSIGQLPGARDLWGSGFSYLNWLLISTAVWLVISVWLGVFLISRRPLNFTPARFSHEFRGLAMFNLKITGFYFLGLALITLIQAYFAAIHNVIIGPLFFAVIYGMLIPGFLGFFAPHYNIHRTLKRERLHELERIDKEVQHYAGKLQELHLSNSRDLQDYVKLSSRLIALQSQERRIAEADDWPLDYHMVSTFSIFVVIPIVINLITNSLRLF